ncbi:hypothetical protein BV25DRAFT_1239656 [Artomyces pyxidatus]|uniref:Uncharacterized protein n=1 Tax=Artomyces pyxidatus TaxID=48021 RepID=A0ACB8SQ32_9AGAM|nr:hypothetical protein BV25DRAFT_1239656 [Artomyces pyxidatus]
MSAFGGGSVFGSSNTTQQPGQSGGLFGGLGSNNTTNTGGTSAFGTAQNAQGSATGGSAFGTGGGLFGNSNQNQPSNTTQTGGGGLFGGGSNQATGGGGGGLFGGGNTGQQSGGLFGNTGTQQPATGGGLFGGASTQSQQQQPQQGGGLFGTNTTQQPASGGLFGNTATQQQQPATGGGLFGSSTTQSNQQPAAGGGLFGSTTTQPSTGGLFGLNTNTQPSTGGLFGSTATTQPASGTGGLFGNNASTSTGATGGGLFGSTNNTTSSTGTGGLFGSQQPSTTTQSSLFGGGQTQQQQQQPTNSLFGGSQATQQPQTQNSGLLGGSLLGGTGTSTQNSLFASKTAVAPAQQQADAQTQFSQLSQRMEAIVGAWTPNSPLNRFQHYFYNLVDPAQVHLYGRPANATNEALWQRAVRENPDPSCLVPVLATSFDDLQKRVEAQTQQATAHQEKLKEIRSRIEKLSERHDMSNAARLNKATAAQAQLTHRLLKLVQHLHLLIPALRSSSIRPEEEALRAVLEEIDGEIRRPGGMGRIVGKLNELWALVGALNAMRSGHSRGVSDGVEWAVVDEDGLNQIVQILAEQQAGLAHLTKILQKDLRDTAVIYGEGETEDESRGRSDLLSSFSQTLRSSTIR